MAAEMSSEEEGLLARLEDAIASSHKPVREVEVGLALSIALGRQRTPVSCGGCSTGLEVKGIPARTNPRLREPFRLVFGEPAPSV